MITRDGKLETVINGRGVVTPSITVISHEEPPYDSVPLGRSGRLPSSVPPPLPPHQLPSTASATQTPSSHPYQYSNRGLPRQGSSSLESTTASAPIHVHTVECAQRYSLKCYLIRIFIYSKYIQLQPYYLLYSPTLTPTPTPFFIYLYTKLFFKGLASSIA